MKIKVSISREFDLDGDHADLFEGVQDNNSYALSLFAEDIAYLVKYNEVKDNALVEVIQ